MVEGPNRNRDGISEGARGRASGRRSLRSPGEALQPDLPPPPPSSPRKRRPIIATLSGVFSFLGIAAIGIVALVSFGLQRLNAPGPLPADKIVYVEGNKSDIVTQLENEGVIDSWTLMMAGLTLRDTGQRKLLAGEYKFKQAASLDDVIDTLVNGKQIQHSITIPEGLTSEQVVQRLMEDETLIGTVRAMPKEGTLMPDTFKFTRGTKRDHIIELMQQEQRKVIAEVWQHHATDTPIKSPYEMLTLASIVEKETGKPEERPRVAGVFTNRLAKGVPLQSDPTIVYGLVGGKGTLGRGILKSELEQKTPYNTYTIVGLPPGPICNPGRAAMEAVANPMRSKEIYFVADGTGGHAFAETLDQHKLNVQHWRQIERDAKDKLQPDSDKVLQSTPTVAVPPKSDQRGDALPAVPIYGALDANVAFSGRPSSLPTMRDLAKADYPMALLDEDRALSKVASMLPAENPAQASDLGADDLTGIPGLEGPPKPAAASAEEQAFASGDLGDGGGMTFPVSPSRLADERARARQFGLASQSDTLPAETQLVSTDPGAGMSPLPPGTNKGKIFDASEGTALDPLRNRTYDLNTPKTVPNFAAFAPVSSVRH